MLIFRITVLTFFLFTFIINISNIPLVHAKDWDPRVFQAYQLAYSGDYLAAEKIAEAILQESPQDPNAYFVRAMVYEWERNLKPIPDGETLKKALKLLQKANQIAFQNWHQDQENVDRLIEVGNSFILLGRLYSEAGSGMRAVLTAKKGPKYIEKALEKDPSRTDGLMTLGIFNYIADKTPGSLSSLKGIFGIKGDATLGLKQLSQAISSQDPYKYDALASLFYMQAFFEKNHSQALQTLQRLQDQFPENPQWMEARASVMEKQSKAQGEQGYLEMVRWCGEKSNRCSKRFISEPYFHAGRLAKDQGKYAEAKTAFTQALTTDLSHRPRYHAEALLWLGESEAKLGQWQEATSHFKAVATVAEAPKELKQKAEQALHRACQSQTQLASCR